ncbi:hypothetical protein V8F33_005109 [Rhypophila sp. PSN 637]
MFVPHSPLTMPWTPRQRLKRELLLLRCLAITRTASACHFCPSRQDLTSISMTIIVKPFRSLCLLIEMLYLYDTGMFSSPLSCTRVIVIKSYDIGPSCAASTLAPVPRGDIGALALLGRY